MRPPLRLPVPLALMVLRNARALQSPSSPPPASGGPNADFSDPDNSQFIPLLFGDETS